MKKSNRKGFTLVELVVVIAIIGILAAILVPTMMNYVKKAKLKSANSSAKLVYTTVNNMAADLMVDGDDAKISGQTVSKISDLKSSDENKKLQNAVYQALSDNGNTAGYACWAIDNTSHNVLVAQWAQTNTANTIVGQYPNPAKTVEHATTQIGTTLNVDDAKWSTANPPVMPTNATPSNP